MMMISDAALMAKPSSIELVFLFFVVLLLAATPPSYSNNQTDFEALIAFKKAIQDDPLRALSSWNDSTHFCSWNGVFCGKRHQDRVVTVFLQSQGLVGSLSPHIGNLSFLRNINLKNNTFRGQIPQEMGRLTRLQLINFNNNSFEGGIPTNLSQCRNLYFLNLIDNNLVGSIIPEIGSLVNLETLGLANNMLSATIPPFLGNLTSLRVLSFSDCGLQGDIPVSLGQLRRLSFLSLEINKLTGEVPLNLYNLSSLEIFSLQYNHLQGTIPSNIFFTLPMLTDFALTNNHFTGQLPASLSNSSSIGSLFIDYNNFTGEMIDVTKLSTLVNLGLSSNHLKGDIGIILSSFTNCTSLLTLQLHENLFTGLLPESIGNLSSHLYLLSTSANHLGGIIPSSIGNLFNIITLAMSDNNLEGPIPWSVGKLHKLQKIYLDGNRLTNEMPLSFSNLTLLSVLYLDRNKFVGNIPPSLGNCTYLLYLGLAENNLNGSIPPEIMMLPSISINLSYNLLNDTIPSEVGNLKNLNYLDFSNNRLSGSIPTSLSKLVMLEVLLLGKNYFQGEIPDNLRALQSLQVLDLSQNNFSGAIPRFLGELGLEYLNLSYNDLQGEVPSLGVFQNKSAISLDGNHRLCGGIVALDLPSCTSTIFKKRELGKILISCAAAICAALLSCFCIVLYKRKRATTTSITILLVPEFLRLSYLDLLKATDGFSSAKLLGAGRYGCVYRGSITINDVQQFVAVKVINLIIRGAQKSFASECNALRGIRHRNLLKILSVCDSIDSGGGDFKALVYEYMANGSLENWLHQVSEEEGRFLNMIQRLNIAIDIASAVEYLHCGTESTIIHGDLKPSNVLLDEDLVAHVGDFGLSKIIASISGNLSATDGSSSSAVKGTIGYIAPEYGMNNVVSTQGDAYSYGILVLELFTNRRPTSDALEGHINLQDFVSNALTDGVMEVVDPFLQDEVKKGDKYRTCIVSVLRIGLRCSEQFPRDRMSMAQVVVELNNIRNMLTA